MGANLKPERYVGKRESEMSDEQRGAITRVKSDLRRKMGEMIANRTGSITRYAPRAPPPHYSPRA